MIELVFLLEELSARRMLEGLLPRVLPEIQPKFIVFNGKKDLEKNVIPKLRGYLKPGSRFLILRDKDSEDCVAIKQRLIEKCTAAGKPHAIVRIACHHLESWYLADLNAVEKGLNINGIAKLQQKNKFLDPDQLANACDELKKLTKGHYQKVGGSRLIGPHLDIKNTRSKSFAVFMSGLKKAIS